MCPRDDQGPGGNMTWGVLAFSENAEALAAGCWVLTTPMALDPAAEHLYQPARVSVGASSVGAACVPAAHSLQQRMGASGQESAASGMEGAAGCAWLAGWWLAGPLAPAALWIVEG